MGRFDRAWLRLDQGRVVHVEGVRGVRGSQMDEELRALFFSAIDSFPPERQTAAQRWLKERVVLAKVAEQLIADAGADLPSELQ